MKEVEFGTTTPGTLAPRHGKSWRGGMMTCSSRHPGVSWVVEQLPRVQGMHHGFPGHVMGALDDVVVGTPLLRWFPVPWFGIGIRKLVPLLDSRSPFARFVA